MKPFHLFLALLLIFIWGFNWVIMKLGLDEMPPFLMAACRFFLTSMPWVFIVKRPNIPFSSVVIYGFLMFVVQFGFLFSGIYVGIPAGIASVIGQTQVIFTMFFSYLLLKERIYLHQVIGALIAFIGIGLVSWNLEGSITLLGVLLILSSALFWGLGSVYSKKLGKISPFPLVVWGSLIAWPPLLLICYFFEGKEGIFPLVQQISLVSLGAIVYLTYFATFFGFGIWFYLLSRYPLATLAPLTLGIPIVATIFSSLVLNEPFELWNLSAAFLIIIGLAVDLTWHKVYPRSSDK